MTNPQYKSSYSYGTRSPSARKGPLLRKATVTEARTVLSSVLSSYGLDEKIAKYQFVNSWSEIVGEEIAKRSKPDSIRNGILVIRVESSAWAQELSFHKTVILRRLEKFLGEDEMVRDLQFYVVGAIL